MTSWKIRYPFIIYLIRCPIATNLISTIFTNFAKSDNSPLKLKILRFAENFTTSILGLWHSVNWHQHQQPCIFVIFCIAKFQKSASTSDQPLKLSPFPTSILGLMTCAQLFGWKTSRISGFVMWSATVTDKFAHVISRQMALWKGGTELGSLWPGQRFRIGCLWPCEARMRIDSEELDKDLKFALAFFRQGIIEKKTGKGLESAE